AREKGVLTIAIVTKPFSFEGSERARIAQEGLSNIRDKVDALVVIPNDRIFALINKDTSVAKAFGFIDSVLEQAVRAVTEIVNAPGIINVDFADIKAIVKDAGPALIGIGVASGADRSMRAVENAVNSPLLETPLDGAKRVLFAVAGGRDIKMSEISDAAKAVVSNLDANAKIIFGAYYDRSLKDKSLKVTVIAAGFNGLLGGSRLGRELPSLFMSEPKTVVVGSKDKDEDIPDEEAKPEKGDKKKKSITDKSEWDIPAFLRKKKR
ncbi:MAG: cell division protein FtsZ, partial [Candidatus Jorgensenbacteria bacterium]